MPLRSDDFDQETVALFAGDIGSRMCQPASRPARRHEPIAFGRTNSEGRGNGRARSRSPPCLGSVRGCQREETWELTPGSQASMPDAS